MFRTASPSTRPLDGPQPALLGRASRLGLCAAVAAGALVVPVAAGVAAAEDPGVDCAEWDADQFSASVERPLSKLIVTLTYDDSDDPFDVCPYLVNISVRDGDGDVVGSSTADATVVAELTESPDGAYRYSKAYDGCDWEVWVTIEESLPIVFESTDVCIDDFEIVWEPTVPLPPVRPVQPVRPPVVTAPVVSPPLLVAPLPPPALPPFPAFRVAR